MPDAYFRVRMEPLNGPPLYFTFTHHMWSPLPDEAHRFESRTTGLAVTAVLRLVESPHWRMELEAVDFADNDEEDPAHA